MTFYNTASPTCGNLCDDAKRTLTCNNGVFEGQGSHTFGSCQERSCKCEIPDQPGQFTPVNQSRPFYSAERAPCAGQCSDIDLTRTCVEKKVGDDYIYEFNGSASFEHSSCGPPINCDCPLPGDLPKIINEKTTILHTKATVTCGELCSDVPSLNVICKNGQLRDLLTDNPIDINAAGFSYRHQCVQSDECLDCFLPGKGTIKSGADPVTLYTQESFGCEDEQEDFAFKFRCEDSVLYRDNKPYNPSTDPDAPSKYFNSIVSDCTGCKTPWGVTIQEGQTTIGYHVAEAISSCGRGCKSQEMKCEDGKLIGDTEFFNSQACTNTCAEEGGGAPPRLCLLPWQNSFVTPGAKVPMYKKSTVPCGESCNDHFKMATCVLETGSFDVGNEYIYKSCTELCL